MRHSCLFIFIILGFVCVFAQQKHLRNDTTYYFELSENEVLEIIGKNEKSVFDERFLNHHPCTKLLGFFPQMLPKHKYFIAFSYEEFYKYRAFCFPEEFICVVDKVKDETIIVPTDQYDRVLDNLRIVTKKGEYRLQKNALGFVVPAQFKKKNLLLKVDTLVKVLRKEDLDIVWRNKEKKKDFEDDKKNEQFVFVTNLPDYQRGDTLKFKGLFRHGHRFIKRKASLSIMPDDSYSIGKSIKIMTLKPDKYGNYVGQFPIPDSLEGGRDYKLILNAKRLSSGISFAYGPYKLGKSDLSVQYEFESIFKDSLRVVIRYLDQFGKAVPNAFVSVNIVEQPSTHLQLRSKGSLGVSTFQINDRFGLQNVSSISKTYSLGDLNKRGGRIWLNVQATNELGELLEYSNDVYVNDTRKFVQSTFKDDLLRFDFYYGREVANVEAIAKYGNSDRVSQNIKLPHTFDLRKEAVPSSLTIGDLRYEINDLKYNIPISVSYSGDTLKINNPTKILATVRLFSKKRFLLDTSIADHAGLKISAKRSYQLKMRFLYKGKFYNYSYSVKPNQSYLAIEQHLPDTISPGSVVQGKVKVLDGQGRPQKNVNITLSAIDYKFSDYGLGSSSDRFAGYPYFYRYYYAADYDQDLEAKYDFKSIFDTINAAFRRSNVTHPFVFQKARQVSSDDSYLKFFIFRNDVLQPYHYVISDTIIKVFHNNCSGMKVSEKAGYHVYKIRLNDAIITTKPIYIAKNTISHISINIDSEQLESAKAGGFAESEIAYLKKRSLCQYGGTRINDIRDLYFSEKNTLVNSDSLKYLRYNKVQGYKTDSILRSYVFENSSSLGSLCHPNDFEALIYDHQTKEPQPDTMIWLSKTIDVSDGQKALLLGYDSVCKIKVVFDDSVHTALFANTIEEVSQYHKVFLPEFGMSLELSKMLNILNLSKKTLTVSPEFGRIINRKEASRFEQGSYFSFRPLIKTDTRSLLAGLAYVAQVFDQVSTLGFAHSRQQGLYGNLARRGFYSYSFLSSKFTYDPINKFSGLGYLFAVSHKVKPSISWNLNVSYNQAFVNHEFGKDLKFLNLSFDNIFDLNGSRAGYWKRRDHVAFGSMGVGNNFKINTLPNRVANAYNFLINLGVGYRYKLGRNWDLNFWAKFPFRITKIHNDRLYDKYWDLTCYLSYMVPSRVLCPKFRDDFDGASKEGKHHEKTNLSTNQNQYLVFENKAPIRSNFSYSGAWVPQLITDKNGEASFAVKYSDNITKWKNHVTVLNTRGQYQSAFTETNAIKKDFLVVNWPEYAVLGDSLVPSYYVKSTKNNTKVRLLQNGTEAPSLDAKKGTIKAQLCLLDSLQTLLDAEKVEIPVLDTSIVYRSTLLHKIKGDTTLSFDLRNRQGFGYKLIPSLNEMIQMYAEDLNRYPYSCGEQLASRILSAAYLHKVDRELVRDLNAKFSHSSGISWWEHSYQINYGLSVYALVALNKATNLSEFSNYRALYDLVLKNMDSLSTFHKWMLAEDKVMPLSKIKLTDKDSTSTEGRMYCARINALKNNQTMGEKEVSEIITSYLSHHKASQPTYTWEETSIKHLAYCIKIQNSKKLIDSSLLVMLRAQLENMVFLQYNKGLNTYEKGLLAWANMDRKAHLSHTSKAGVKKEIKKDSCYLTIKSHTGYVQTSFDSISTSIKGDEMLKIETDMPSRAAKGDKILMKVRLQNQNTYRFMLINVPLPAGCKLLSVKNVHPDSYRLDQGQISIYLDRLSKGIHEYVLELLCETKGRFHLKPSQVHHMYFEPLEAHEQLKSINIE